MEIVFTGVIPEYGSVVPVNQITELVMKMDNSFGFSQVMQGLFNQKNGSAFFPSPAPFILKLSFPSGAVEYKTGLGYTTSGSGSGFVDEILKSWHKIALQGDRNFRSLILQSMLADYCKNSGIDTIGGMVQVWYVDSSGARPHSYEIKQMDAIGTVQRSQSMVFTEKGWVQLDSLTGKKIIASHDLKFINNDENLFPNAKARKVKRLRGK